MAKKETLGEEHMRLVHSDGSECKDGCDATPRRASLKKRERPLETVQKMKAEMQLSTLLEIREAMREALASLDRLIEQKAPLERSKKPERVVHWVRTFPEKKAAEIRGFHCGAPFDAKCASSYIDQVTCEACNPFHQLEKDRKE
jgi:hypothetical protein